MDPRRPPVEYLPSGKFWTDRKIYRLGDTVTIYWEDIPIKTEAGWYTCLFVGYPVESPCAKRLLEQGKELIAYRVAVGASSGEESFVLPVEHCVGEYGAMIADFYLQEFGGDSNQLARIYFTVVTEEAKTVTFKSVPTGAEIGLKRY